MCPPRRVVGSNARSKFTVLPAASCPRTGQGLLHDVGDERGIIKLRDSQAHAVDGDGVAELGIRSHYWRIDAHANGVTELLQFNDLALFFNEPSKQSNLL